jgi:hypothetical protein
MDTRPEAKPSQTEFTHQSKTKPAAQHCRGGFPEFELKLI